MNLEKRLDSSKILQNAPILGAFRPFTSNFEDGTTKHTIDKVVHGIQVATRIGFDISMMYAGYKLGENAFGETAQLANGITSIIYPLAKRNALTQITRATTTLHEKKVLPFVRQLEERNHYFLAGSLENLSTGVQKVAHTMALTGGVGFETIPSIGLTLGASALESFADEHQDNTALYAMGKLGAAGTMAGLATNSTLHAPQQTYDQHDIIQDTGLVLAGAGASYIHDKMEGNRIGITRRLATFIPALALVACGGDPTPEYIVVTATPESTETPTETPRPTYTPEPTHTPRLTYTPQSTRTPLATEIPLTSTPLPESTTCTVPDFDFLEVENCENDFRDANAGCTPYSYNQMASANDSAIVQLTQGELLEIGLDSVPHSGSNGVIFYDQDAPFELCESTPVLATYPWQVPADIVGVEQWEGEIPQDFTVSELQAAIDAHPQNRVLARYSVPIFVIEAQRNAGYSDFAEDFVFPDPTWIKEYVEDFGVKSSSTLAAVTPEPSSTPVQTDTFDIQLFAPFYSGSDAEVLEASEFYDLSIIHDDYFGHLTDEMRDVNEDMEIFQYKSSFSCFNPEFSHETIDISGLPDPWTAPADELAEFFTTDAQGNVLKDQYDEGSHECYMPNYGSASFQEYAIPQFVSALSDAQGDYDGLFLDVIPLDAMVGEQGGIPNQGADAFYDGLFNFIEELDDAMDDQGYSLIPNFAPYIFQQDFVESDQIWNLADGGLDEFFIYKYNWRPMSPDVVDYQISTADFAAENDLYFLAASQTFCEPEATQQVLQSLPQGEKTFVYPMSDFSYSAGVANRSYQCLVDQGFIE